MSAGTGGEVRSPERPRVAAEFPTAEVLERVRATLDRRRALGVVVPPPQALLPLDADEVEPLESMPWRIAVGTRVDVDLEHLLLAPRAAFVERCYRRLLLRNPEPGEAQRDALERDGVWTRMRLLVRLRASAEGRRAGVRILGLAPRRFLKLARKFARRARRCEEPAG
jgi:hypothetical protein